jgi:hypothetical protein
MGDELKAATDATKRNDRASFMFVRLLLKGQEHLWWDLFVKQWDVYGKKDVIQPITSFRNVSNQLDADVTKDMP